MNGNYFIVENVQFAAPLDVTHIAPMSFPSDLDIKYLIN